MSPLRVSNFNKGYVRGSLLLRAGRRDKVLKLARSCWWRSASYTEGIRAALDTYDIEYWNYHYGLKRK